MHHSRLGRLVTASTQVNIADGPAWLHMDATVNCTGRGFCGANESLRCQNWDRLLSFCAILAEAHSITRERCMCIFIEIVASTSTTTADTIDYVVTGKRLLDCGSGLFTFRDDTVEERHIAASW